MQGRAKRVHFTLAAEARRGPYKEAAGVSSLHSRRHEAELRLRAAEANLARLADVMISNPITVRVDKLAVEVLNLFEAHRIGDLIVVDRRNHPVGLVDAQDLAKVKLL